MKRNTTAMAALLLGTATLAQAQPFNPALLEPKVLRIEVTPAQGKPSAASGFLWKTNDQVVTSLHAVPGGAAIVVECLGRRVRATVAAVLPRADLVLLKAASSLDGCSPFSSADEQVPAANSELHTYGFHAGTKSGTSRRFNKGYTPNETLEGIINGPALQAVRDMGMPATDLRIYYVEGGLLPGYSGAPVVNGAGRLVGIADGGLNNGASNYNWVIPARHLGELTASTSNVVPPQVARGSSVHFSAGLAVADERSVIAYEMGGKRFRFIKTKTQSLQALAASSNDPDGVRRLVQTYQGAVGGHLLAQMYFDVYEELDQGLIIAVPANQRPRFERPAPGASWFIAEVPPNGYNGHVQFEIRNRQSLLSVNAPVLMPSDPRYLQAFVAGLLEDCAREGKRCQVDRNTVRRVDLGNGRVLIKVGLVAAATANQSAHYDYYSLAAQGDEVFRAFARFHWAGNGGLLNCAAQPRLPDCADPTNAANNLAQIVAAHITTFSGLRAP